MPKFFRRKRFWIILAVVIVAIIVAVAFLFPSTPATTYTTEAAKVGQIVQTVSATGMVESAHEINLNFNGSGKITEVKVKQGQEVKASDVLARLDSGSISATIKADEAALASAKANLEKIKAGSSAEDVALTSQQLIKAQNDYNSLSVESDTQTRVYREKVIDSLNNAVFYIQTALNTVYNGLLDSSLKSSLAVSDTNLQNKVTQDYSTLKTDFAALRATIDAAKAGNGDQDKIIAAADATRDYLNRLSNYLDNAYSLADKILVNAAIDQADKDTIKADLSAQQTANNSSLSAVQTARSSLINGVTSYESQLQAASNSVAIAQAQLDLKKAGPRDFDIAAAQAQVNQAQAALDKARSDADSYVIKAPIDGKITKVNYAVGETPTAAEAVIVMLGNERYEIKVDIAESDITKVKVGDKTVIELDAFGSDHPFSGAVTFIDPAQTVIKDVTYYKTTITFNTDSWSDQIKPGMTASITIAAAEKNNVLYIPQRAVKIRASTLGEVPQKYVEVLAGGQKQEKNVEIGLRGDDGLVEIVSGLAEGEQVITYTQSNSQ